MSSIFISYSRMDAKVADEIATILSTFGIEYFRDVKDIEWGDAINSRVRDALQSCVAVLVIISPGSLKSQWVPYEIGHASALKKKILPFLTHPSIEIPLYMRDLNFVTTYDQVRDYFSRLPPEPETPQAADPDQPIAAIAQSLQKMMLEIRAEMSALNEKLQQADQKDETEKEKISERIAALENERLSLKEKADEANKGIMPKRGRKSVVFGGMVLTAENLAGYPIEVEAVIRDPMGRERRSTITIPS